MKKALQGKVTGKRQRNDEVVPDLSNSDVVSDIVNNQSAETENITRKITEMKDGLSKKTEDVQESVEVVVHDQGEMKTVVDAIMEEVKYVKKHIDVVETKVFVVASDVADVKIKTEKQSDTETISLTNKLNVLSEDVARLAEQLTQVSAQITAFV